MEIDELSTKARSIEQQKEIERKGEGRREKMKKERQGKRDEYLQITRENILQLNTFPVVFSS